jgi:hypothetical protein
MAMQQIGIPARKVIADIDAKRAGANPAKIEAARQHTGGMDDEPLAQDMPAHPVSGIEGSAATGLNEVKKTGAGKAPASFRSLSNKRREVGATVTSLPVGRGMESVNRRKQGLPRPALSRPVLTVIIGGRHAPTGI